MENEDKIKMIKKLKELTETYDSGKSTINELNEIFEKNNTNIRIKKEMLEPLKEAIDNLKTQLFGEGILKEEQ